MRLIVADLLTNQRLGEWRPVGVTWEAQRDRPGTIKGTVMDPNPATVFDRPAAIYCVYPDGSIPWSGILWGMWPSSYDSAEYKFAGAGWTSILDFRKVRNAYAFRDVDQATIVSTLLADAQTGTNGALPWVIDCPSTGRKRDVTIPPEERKSVLKYLTDWCDNIDGFDFDVTTDETYVNTFHLRYPRDSRVAHTIVNRPNVSITKWEDDWTFVANNIDVKGSEGLAYTLLGDPASGWPRLDGDFSSESVTQMPTLIQKAERLRDLHATPLLSAELRITDGELPTGARMLGHDVRVIDTDASGRDAWFQLVAVKGEWVGATPVEVWTLEQQLRVEEV